MVLIFLLGFLVAYIYTYSNRKNAEIANYKTQIEQLQDENRTLERSIDELESITNKPNRMIKPEPANSSKISEYNLLEEYTIDIDKDSNNETVELYAQVEKGEDGDYAWDDGQRWLLLVRDEEQVYTLFDDYVQLGRIEVHPYESYNEDSTGFHLITILNTTAGIIIKDYNFGSKSDYFKEELIFETDDISNFTTLRAPVF